MLQIKRSKAKEIYLQTHLLNKDFAFHNNYIILSKNREIELMTWQTERINLVSYLKVRGIQGKDAHYILRQAKTDGLVEECWQSILSDGKFVRRDQLDLVDRMLSTYVPKPTVKTISKSALQRNHGITQKRINKAMDLRMLDAPRKILALEKTLAEVTREQEYVDISDVLLTIERKNGFCVKKSRIPDIVSHLMILGQCVSAQQLPLVGKRGHYYVLNNDDTNESIVAYVRDNWKVLEVAKSYEFLFENLDEDFRKFFLRYWRIPGDLCPIQHRGQINQILGVLGTAQKEVKAFTNGDIQHMLDRLTPSIRDDYERMMKAYDKYRRGDVAYNPGAIMLRHIDPIEKKSRDPYNLRVYKAVAIAIYTQFGDREGVYERAYQDSESAQVLLLLGLHIACAWRLHDFCRVKGLACIMDKMGEFTELILSHDYDNPLFLSIYNILYQQILGMRASKQKGELTIACPPQFRSRLGVMVVLATMHMMQDGRDTLINPSVCYKDEAYERLLGSDIYQCIFGEKGFRSSRLVKTLLQEQAYLTKDHNNDYSRMPEIVAAYLRGHKFQLDTHQKNIYYYIDNSTRDYSADEVLLELWLQDTAGQYKALVASLLIDNYRSIDLKEQTELMHAICGDLSPAEIERQCREIYNLVEVTNHLVVELPKTTDEFRERLGKMLHRTQSAREDHVECLYAVLTGQRCKSRDGKSCCIGNEGQRCDYALYNRAYVETLAQRRKTIFLEAQKYLQYLSNPSISEQEATIIQNTLQIHQWRIEQLNILIVDFVKEFGVNDWEREVILGLLQGKEDINVFSPVYRGDRGSTKTTTIF